MTTETLSSREVATKLDTDPRALRRFLRSDASPMKNTARGARYEFTAEDVPSLKKAFVTWSRSEKAAPASRPAPAKKKARAKK